MKKKLFFEIPVNFALWNGETWSGNKFDLNLLDVFFHKAIRRILNISMSRVKEERISNFRLRKKFRADRSLSEAWRFHLLKFVGRTVRQDDNALSKLFLAAHIDGPLLRGRPFRKNKDLILDYLFTDNR